MCVVWGKEVVSYLQLPDYLCRLWLWSLLCPALGGGLVWQLRPQAESTWICSHFWRVQERLFKPCESKNTWIQPEELVQLGQDERARNKFQKPKYCARRCIWHGEQKAKQGEGVGGRGMATGHGLDRGNHAHVCVRVSSWPVAVFYRIPEVRYFRTEVSLAVLEVH